MKPLRFTAESTEPRPLFVSVLLHGNEDTGLAAAQEVLRRHLSHELHRSLLLFAVSRWIARLIENFRQFPFALGDFPFPEHPLALGDQRREGRAFLT